MKNNVFIMLGQNGTKRDKTGQSSRLVPKYAIYHYKAGQGGTRRDKHRFLSRVPGQGGTGQYNIPPL